MNNKKTQHLSFDYLEMLIETNLDELIKDVENELILDCIDMRMLNQFGDDDDGTIEYIFQYISKYSFFVYHFEKNEKYEHCASLRKMFITVLCDSFMLEKQTAEDLFTSSLTSFRENKEL